MSDTPQIVTPMGRRPWAQLDRRVHQLNRTHQRTPHWVSRLLCRLRGQHGSTYFTRY